MRKKAMFLFVFLLIGLFTLTACKKEKISKIEIKGTPQTEFEVHDQLELEIEVTSGKKRFEGTYKIVVNEEGAIDMAASKLRKLTDAKIDVKADGFNTTKSGKKTYKITIDKVSVSHDYVVHPMDLKDTGKGTEEEPYLISDPAHFFGNDDHLTIAKLLGNDESVEGDVPENHELHFKLINDIDFLGIDYQPVEIKRTDLVKLVFDGNKKTLSNVKCERELFDGPTREEYESVAAGKKTSQFYRFPENRAGLFTDERTDNPDAKFIFKNLTVKNSSFKSCSYTAAVLGYVGGTKTSLTFENMSVLSTNISTTHWGGCFIGQSAIGKELEFIKCKAEDCKLSGVWNIKALETKKATSYEAEVKGDDGDKIGALVGQLQGSPEVKFNDIVIGAKVYGTRDCGLLAGHIDEVAYEKTTLGKLKILNGTEIVAEKLPLNAPTSAGYEAQATAGLLFGTVAGPATRTFSESGKPSGTYINTDNFKLQDQDGALLSFDDNKGELTTNPSGIEVRSGNPLAATRWTQGGTDKIRFIGAVRSPNIKGTGTDSDPQYPKGFYVPDGSGTRID